MNEHCCWCRKCLEVEDDGYGLAMWEGEIVGPDDPGPWGGQNCCRSCYEMEQRGELPRRLFPWQAPDELLALP